MNIGLALSGGGILGVAHIGLLKHLEDQKIKTCSICATSAGAIIGSLYSAGGIHRVEQFIKYLSGQGLFDKGKIILPNKLKEIMTSALILFLEGSNFDNLRHQFSCVATNISTGQSIVISDGNLIEAVLASSAYPGFFKIRKINQDYLFDGGVLMNLPASILKKQNLDFIIGSYLGEIVYFNNIDQIKLNRLDIFSRAIDIAQHKMSQSEIDICDYCFIPPVNNYKWNQFDKMTHIRQIGFDYASEKINELSGVLLDRMKLLNLDS